MNNLLDAFSEFKEFKNIDRPTLVRVVEDVFRTLIRKKYGTDDNFDVIVNTDKGDLEIVRTRTIVPDKDVEDELTQIGLSEAKRIDVSYEIGEDCYEDISIDGDFGRRAVTSARQTLVSRVLELEKDEVYKRYVDRVGEMVTGEVSQILKKEFLIMDDATGNELMLPRTEMIRGDYYRKGEVVKAIIERVDMKNNNPQVILSRTSEKFLEKLLEGEVPELDEGTIQIKKIVRAPGERAKIAVQSFDDHIDPVGACVGIRGARISGIVRELRNENIDVINWTDNGSLLIQRSLTPAKITSIELDPARMRASVFLKPEEVSKAIGKMGLNIKLASRLTGYEIDVYRDREGDEEGSEDVAIDEFRDEIEDWIIDEFKKIGCDTARSVLNIGLEDLVRRTDLEEETIRDVINIFKAELD